jgi:hypothetical protein
LDKIKIMKKIIITGLALFITVASFSQTAKSVYVEAGGPGLLSMNFDTRFTKREDGIGGRVGVGGFKIGGTGAVFVPVGINYITSKDNKNYFEIGAGATYVSASADYNSELFEETFGHTTIGYRYQPKNGGVVFRAAITPVFGKGFFVPYYGGVSIGYKF